MNDIAQMKSLLPELITFAYIDAELLRVHSAGSETKARQQQKKMELDEAYRLAGSGAAEERAKKDKGEVVLLFEFNDGELKSSNGVGKVFNRKLKYVSSYRESAIPVSDRICSHRRKKSSKDEGSPSPQPLEPVTKFTKESMTTLIEKRNAKFSAAVSELLVACEAHQPREDPIALLLGATEENLPVKPGGDEERKGLEERKDDLAFYQRNPGKRPSIEVIIEEIREQAQYRDQIVEGGHRIFDATEGVYGTFRSDGLFCLRESTDGDPFPRAQASST
jgi:DEAD/DEAH box helicase domain-containing protein